MTREEAKTYARLAIQSLKNDNDEDTIACEFYTCVLKELSAEPQEWISREVILNKIAEIDKLSKTGKTDEALALLKECFESLTPKQTEWISVKDRLPEETGEYLVYTDNDEFFIKPYDEWQADFGYWYEEFSEETGGKIGEEWRSADDNCMKVVAWMPLPSPYKGE